MNKCDIKIRTHQIFNGLGAGNIGDELMLIGFWNCFHVAKGSTVEVWSLDSPVMQWLPGDFKYIPWAQDDLCQGAALSADAVLLVGDTPVSEELGLDWPLRSLSKRLNYCHSKGIPVHAIGVGVDHLLSPDAIKIFKEAYLPIKSWTVRSTQCRDALLTLGVEADKIAVAADLAWLYTPPKDYSAWGAKQWQRLGIDLNKPLIGVNVVNEIWSNNKIVKKNIALALDEVVKTYQAQVAFLCNETRQGDYYDAVSARQVMSLMHEPSVLLPNEYYHPDQMIALLSHVDVTISQRYHFTIESILAGTVPVNFARGQKMGGLLSELSIEPVGTMEELNAKTLSSAIADVFDRRYYWLNHLVALREELATRAKNNAHFTHLLVKSPRLEKVSASIKKILITRFDTLGDIILLAGFIEALKQKLPEAEITLLVREGYDQLAPLFPESLEWITTKLYPYRDYEEKDLSEITSLLNKIGNKNWDLLLITTYNRTWIDHIVTAKLQGTTRIAIGEVKELKGWTKELLLKLNLTTQDLFEKLIPVPEKSHEIEKYQILWDNLFIDGSKLPFPKLHIDKNTSGKAKKALFELGLSPNQYFVCFPAGTQNVTIKTWPLERFVQVITWICKEYNILPLLVGHENEREIIEELEKMLRDHQIIPAIWLGKQGDIPILAALLHNAFLYVGNDSGPLHMACAVGIPVVGIYGGGTYPRFQPVGLHAIGVAGCLPCFGCYWDCILGDALCMRLVSAEDVIKAVKMVLNEEPVQSNYLSTSDSIDPKLFEYVNKTKKRFDDYEKTINYYQQRLLACEAIITTMKSSRIWRITKPIRDFVDLLKQIIKR